MYAYVNQFHLCYLRVEDSHLIPTHYSNSNVKSNTKLIAWWRPKNTNMNYMLHPYEMRTTYDQMHFSSCGWLASSLIIARLREYHLNITWTIMNLSMLGVACFSWSSNLSTKNVISTHNNQMALYLILVMLLAPLKTKPKFLNHL